MRKQAGGGGGGGSAAASEWKSISLPRKNANPPSGHVPLASLPRCIHRAPPPDSDPLFGIADFFLHPALFSVFFLYSRSAGHAGQRNR